MNKYTYTSEDKLYFFIDLEDIMNSDLELVKDGDVLSALKVLSIPVIATSDLQGINIR